MDSFEDPERQAMLQEQIERLSPIYWPLKLVGFARYDITQGRIVQKSSFSLLLSLLTLFIIHSCTFYVIYALSVETDYLLITEVILLLDFLGFHTALLLNTFVNRNSAAKFLNTSVELDVFLGTKETMFMRDIFSNTYFILSSCVGLSEIAIVIVLFITYVIDFAVYISGAILILLLYFIFYDLSFFLSLYTTLTLRVRYLNVAIMKLAKVKLEYLPKQFPFNTVFWNDKYNDLVDFHLRARTENFRQAFVMIFHQLRFLENLYRCTILCCLTYLTVGTFITVQSWIIWAKSTEVELLRTLIIMGWCLLSWMFQFAVSQQTDMFQRQIQQTSLICTFIQLTPTYPAEIYELTASIIRMLEVRDPRVSIYDIFYFDTGLLLRILSSIFVYITMQLQIAFPKNSDSNLIVNNHTDNNL